MKIQNPCGHIPLSSNKYFTLGMGKVGINRAAEIARKRLIPRKNCREGRRSMVFILSAETQPLNTGTSKSFGDHPNQKVLHPDRKEENVHLFVTVAVGAAIFQKIQAIFEFPRPSNYT